MIYVYKSDACEDQRSLSELRIWSMELLLMSNITMNGVACDLQSNKLHGNKWK